jgi:hypothetical protein
MTVTGFDASPEAGSTTRNRLTPRRSSSTYVVNRPDASTIVGRGKFTQFPDE